MTTEPVRAEAGWLALREPADAAARAPELVEELRSHLPTDRVTEVHDLGSGTGSMARWLAERLAGPQHWVLYDRDDELLVHVAADPPRRASDGAAVTVETRRRDVTRLGPEELAGADLVTASALLDMMTADELHSFVAICAGPGCPVLVTLTVVGRVELSPADPLDRSLMQAFNAHQRRTTVAGRLLGPDAAQAAERAFGVLGREVVVRPSPWRLGSDRRALVAEWLTGWVAAACEQRPDLEAAAGAYAQRRLSQLAAGGLTVTVHHQDLLVRPARGGRGLRPGAWPHPARVRRAMDDERRNENEDSDKPNPAGAESTQDPTQDRTDPAAGDQDAEPTQNAPGEEGPTGIDAPRKD